MAVSALSFIYNNIPSEDFGLYIGEFDSSVIKTDMASTNIEFIQDHISERSENFIYKVIQSEKNISFDLNLFSYDYLSKSDISYVDNWLFANKKPKPLVFCQGDMSTYTFHAIFSNNQIVYHGNRAIGFKCKVVLDSTFAYENKQTEVISVFSDESTKVRFNNLSGGINYLYPEISWTCNKDNGMLEIINSSDNNRRFFIDGLKTGEKITIDKWQQIDSSLGLLRRDNCNGGWLRLRNGINILSVKGDTGNLNMTYQFKKAIGS